MYRKSGKPFLEQTSSSLQNLVPLLPSQTSIQSAFNMFISTHKTPLHVNQSNHTLLQIPTNPSNLHNDSTSNAPSSLHSRQQDLRLSFDISNLKNDTNVLSHQSNNHHQGQVINVSEAEDDEDAHSNNDHNRDYAVTSNINLDDTLSFNPHFPYLPRDYHNHHTGFHTQLPTTFLPPLGYNISQLDDLYLSLLQPQMVFTCVRNVEAYHNNPISPKYSANCPQAEEFSSNFPMSLKMRPLPQLTENHQLIAQITPALSILLKQPPNQSCGSCLRVLSRIYCDKCRLYDDKRGKSVTHCQQCNICRQGQTNHLVHCERCGCCFNSSTLKRWFAEGKSSYDSIYLRGEEIALRMGQIYSSLQITYPNTYDLSTTMLMDERKKSDIEFERDSLIMKHLDLWYYELLPTTVQDKLFFLCSQPQQASSPNLNDNKIDGKNEVSPNLSKNIVASTELQIYDIIHENDSDDDNIQICIDPPPPSLLLHGKYIVPNFNPKNNGDYSYLKPYCINMNETIAINSQQITRAFQKKKVLQSFPQIGINVSQAVWFGEVSHFLVTHNINPNEDNNTENLQDFSTINDNSSYRPNCISPTCYQPHHPPIPCHKSNLCNPFHTLPILTPISPPSPLYHYQLAHPKYNPLLRIRAEYGTGIPILLPTTLPPTLLKQFVECDDGLVYPHSCSFKVLKQRCSICLQSLGFGSGPISTLSCRHSIHGSCLKQAMNSGVNKCPVCKKTIMRNYTQDDHITAYLFSSQMPDAWATVAAIGCNDCGVSNQLVRHNASHNQCLNCKSYNTFSIEVFTREASLQTFPQILSNTTV